MGRALRVERVGGRYHATARGNERKSIFRDEEDHFHFLELLSELGERFGSRVHAYVLMDNLGWVGFAGNRWHGSVEVTTMRSVGRRCASTPRGRYGRG